MSRLFYTFMLCLFALMLSLTLSDDSSENVADPMHAMATGVFLFDNGTGMAFHEGNLHKLEKRFGRDRPIGTLTYYSTSWYTTWIDTESDDDDCHHHHRGCHRPCPPHKTTVFVVPSTMTQTESRTVTTLETIPVPCLPCEARCNGYDGPVCLPPPRCHECEVVVNGCHTIIRTRSACYCTGNGGGSGGGAIVSTTSLPLTSSPPQSTVITLITATKSVTIFTVTAPSSTGGTNAAPKTYTVSNITASLFFALMVTFAIL